MGGIFSRARGQGESSTSSAIDPGPTYIQKLNDSLFLLHECGGTPKVDIIFFHGLQEDGGHNKAYWKSWMTLSKSDFERDDPDATEAEEKSVCWPSEWLGQDVEGARIYSVAYDASTKQTSRQGRLDMTNIAENQYSELLVLAENHGIGQACPVILVGHSIGGLVIKNLLLTAQEEADRLKRAFEKSGRKEGGEFHRVVKFLENVKGVFFYSTPQSGTRLTDFIEKAQKANGNKTSPIMSYFSTLSKDSARLNGKFQKWRQGTVETYTVGEAWTTSKWGFDGIVAEEGSCRNDTDYYYTANADHFTVTRPRNRIDAIYANLRSFVATLCPEIPLQNLDLQNPIPQVQINDGLT